MLRGALAFSFAAQAAPSNSAIRSRENSDARSHPREDWMVDLTMAGQNVNATTGNKKVLIGPRALSRMNSLKHVSEGKTMFRALPRRSYRSSVARIERSVSSSYQEFPNYRAFVKGELSLQPSGQDVRSAGAGNQYHHIVTQGGLNGKKFPAELLQTRATSPFPTLLHEVVTDEYRKPAPDGSGRTLYRWLQTQPYEVQREIG